MTANKRHRIAVVGAGIAGLAAATFLRRDGHDVSVFERFPSARPVGSGLVLQRSGLSILARLGLADPAVEMGARLTHFEGKTFSGRTVFDLRLPDASQLSLGIHRHALFSLLFERAVALGVTVTTAREIESISEEGGQARINDTCDGVAGGFDLVVDASGAHSKLRDRHAKVLRRLPFAHGALWGVCEVVDAWPLDTLRQRFRRADVSVGVIPIGRKPGGGASQHVGFHWSIRNSDYRKWRERPIGDWKEMVSGLWPEAAPLVSQIGSHDDLAWAAYSDVALKRLYVGRLAFIGDAAHSISPRLGQGANLGLVDAFVLSRCLEGSAGIDEALARFDRERRDHVRFYHSASKWLSLLFQSDSRVAPLLRDIAFEPVSRIPFMRRQMLDSLSGVKTGLFSTLEI